MDTAKNTSTQHGSGALDETGRSESSAPMTTAGEDSLFAGFVGDLVVRGRRPKTVDSYRSDWVGLSAWWEQTYREPFEAGRLVADAVEAYKRALTVARMTPATVNRKLVFIKRYATWAHEKGVLDAKPHAGVRGVSAVAQAPRRPRGLSDLELRRFLRELDARACLRDQAIVYTLLQSGLRVGELVALRREQVGIGARSGFIRVEDERGHANRARRIALGPNARRTLRAYLDERGDHDGPLFLGERGPLSANAVQRMVRKYCAFAKVRVSPQVLRHTFANGFLLDNGGDLVGLADALGHQSLDTTRLYVAEEEPDEGEAVARREGGVRPVAINGGRS